MPGRESVRPERLESVARLKRTLVAAPMTALVGIRGVPASALQRMRRELRERGHPIAVSTNTQLRHAIEEASEQRPALRPLLEHVVDQTAVLTAQGNPFSLAGEFARTRSPTPARGGEVAPKDILVPAQTTSFKPGPIVGELQHAGFPAAIEKGKVVLKRDIMIVKSGATISREVAGMLTRLEIFPLEVGLELRALLDGDTFYQPQVLSVDLDARRADLSRAHHQALALAMEIGYTTPATIPLLLAKAHRRAIALAVGAGYPTKATLPALLARGLREAAALQNLTGA
ncbi:MAG: 50S ribosomal protein L10 [Thermoplasmata archaeon]|nr:50S ribosomal protein L10 [Thermoplasmata archaeon]MCI4359444.1 50S ribosomal protein L10 [Thermoplasmata archaeon]